MTLDGHKPHRSGAGIRYQQKNDYCGNLDFLLETTLSLSYYFIAVFRLTKSTTLLFAPIWPALSKFP